MPAALSGLTRHCCVAARFALTVPRMDTGGFHPSIVSMLDYAGVATFAASGALMAAEKRQDVVTFIFFAAITGVGGGTLRDLLIGAPVFWVLDPGYAIVCAAMGVLVFVSR